ncbi:hypothetical protein ASE01_08945 [Nocardioides sp. Root190]|uniref:hypothetical protein n=1 Tax=Nocardioides sp. Root190 TaxID=1736488 RepID=UPI0006FC902B|nr:hypothetical protein [Nocardioides sp. Root190]KRB76886.1 hypothetical protein ASE01_08945 [Nocardioides sp. Root190]
MKVNSTATTRWRHRGLTAVTGFALVAAPLALAPQPAQAEGEEESGWSYQVESVDTPISQGYQSAFDPVNRKFYRTDAQARSDVRFRETVYDSNEQEIGWKWGYSTTGGAAKLVEVDAKTKTVSKQFDYTNLTRLNGGRENQAQSWAGIAWSPNGQGQQSQSSLRTHFSPNGLAIDPSADPTFVSVHVRQQMTGNDITQTNGGANYGYGGGIVIFNKSQGAPTDADRLWKLADGSPILDNARQVAVNTVTNKAYVASMGAKNGNANRPGHLTVIDLATKTVEARIALPLRDGAFNQVSGDLTAGQNYGALDVTIDEENEIAYTGLIVSNGGGGTFKVPVIAVDVSDANLVKDGGADLHANDAKVDVLPATVTHNARPVFDADTKRIYVASYSNQTVEGQANGQISVVDGDTSSATYGTVIDSVQANYINSVAVDSERGIVYAADNSANVVRAYDADTLEPLIAVPGSGRVNDVAVDEVTGEVWVGMFSFSGTSAATTDVFRIFEPGVEPHGNDAVEFEVANTTSSYGTAGRTTVLVTDEDGREATGNLTISGAGAAQTVKLKRGEATFTLPSTLAAKAYALTFSYGGNSQLTAAGTTATHTVAKAATRTTVKVATVPTSKKAGKVTVTTSPKASGKITIVLTKGSSRKTIISALPSAGTRSVAVPKLAKGTWKITVTYAGGANHKASTGTTTVKVVK